MYQTPHSSAAHSQANGLHTNAMNLTNNNNSINIAHNAQTSESGYLAIHEIKRNSNDFSDCNQQKRNSRFLYQSSLNSNDVSIAVNEEHNSHKKFKKNVTFAPTTIATNTNNNNNLNITTIQMDTHNQNTNNNTQTPQTRTEHALSIESVQSNTSLPLSVSACDSDFTVTSGSACSSTNSAQTPSSSSNSGNKLKLQHHQSSTSFRPKNSHLHFNNMSSQSQNESVSSVGSASNTSLNSSKTKGSAYKSNCPRKIDGKCKCKWLLKGDDIACEIWYGCSRKRNLAYFDGMYGILCKYFQNQVDTDRVPSKQSIAEIITLKGAFLLEENTHNHYNGPIIVNDGSLVIDICHFLMFWRWFAECCQIIKFVYSLWDDRLPFQCDLFINRTNCENILQFAPQATFLLRLSQSHVNCLVLSYVEPTFNRDRKMRHILLQRHSQNKYVVRTQNKYDKKANSITELNQLIRSFVKLQYLYTPDQIFKKNVVF